MTGLFLGGPLFKSFSLQWFSLAFFSRVCVCFFGVGFGVRSGTVAVVVDVGSVVVPDVCGCHQTGDNWTCGENRTWRPEQQRIETRPEMRLGNRGGLSDMTNLFWRGGGGRNTFQVVQRLSRGKSSLSVEYGV